jgi:peptidoglycan hydrolase-like protein with peptidoglycan-binding domain
MQKVHMTVICCAVIFSTLTIFNIAHAYDEAVHKAQSRLKELGYDPGSVDGIWGKKTKSAVEKFQEDKGLKITGILDEATSNALGIQNRPATSSRCAASYTINVTVELSSTITRGQNRVMVELRQGAPGTSRVFDTKYFEGQTGTVSFSKMCAGSYFIAIGNGDSVAVGPVRQFSESQSVHTRVVVTPSSGNVGTRSRSGL